MLKKISNLSLRWKFMLAPVLGIIFTFILAISFISTETEQRKKLSTIQKITMENSRVLTHLATLLASNHAHAYELLKIAADGGDEARLYEMGKPLLNNVHRIERETLLASSNINSTDLIIKNIADYKKQIITAVEMSTVDLSLAYKYMTLASSEFNKANAAFLKTNKAMQNNLKTQLLDFHRETDATLYKYSVFFIAVIFIVIIISYLLAKLLSQDIQHSINTLNKLATNDNTETTRSEVAQLNQVINHVKQSHFKLKKIRNELKQQKNQLRSILDNMVDGVITINEDGTVLSFNKAAEKAFSYSVAEITGENISKLISNHDEYLKKYLQKDKTQILGVGREVKAIRKNKETFPIYLSVTELPINIKGKRHFVGCFRDITITKQQEQQIRRSQKMDALGKLTGGIAHDYNNMLGVILGYSELLISVLPHQTEKINYVKTIIHAAKRSVKLTSKLMAFSRLKKNDAEKLSLNNLIKNQQHMLEKTLTVRIKLTLDLDKNLWPIKVDIGDLEDAILNICINAMHAIPENGSLTIQTQNNTIEKNNISPIELQLGDYVRLDIIDTGCGMNEETLNKIFDPFYSTKGDLGTGLGLSQVYGFIERSHGAIKVYSELGHGSRFSLYFPRLLEKINDTSNKKTDSEKNIEGTETILVVDDEPELLNLCSTMLQQYGYKTFTADNAFQALAILKKESVDLMLSDVIMPDTDGFKLANAVQKKYPKIKIQLISGFSDNRHVNSSDKSLNDNLIHKPYNSQVLLTRIRELLDNNE